MTKTPISRILAPLTAMTPPRITKTPKAETRTKIFDRETTCFSPMSRCAKRPKTRGTKMTFITVMAMAVKDTSTHCPAKPQR